MTSLLSCGTKQTEQNFPTVENQTIQNVSRVVIDKICGDTTSHLIKPILFGNTLDRFHLTQNPDSVSERDMLNYLISDKLFIDTIPFLKTDSIYLVAQERQIERIKLTESECINLKSNSELADTQERLLKENKFTLGGYYTLSIPVFSLDKKTAVVSLEFHGFSMDSYYRQVFVLRQINQVWTIVKIKTIAMA